MGGAVPKIMHYFLNMWRWTNLVNRLVIVLVFCHYQYYNTGISKFRTGHCQTSMMIHGKVRRCKRF